MFGDVGKTQFDWNFTLFGIPIQIHPIFWVIGFFLSPMVGQEISDLIRWLTGMAAWLTAFFLSILIHELGHGLVVQRIFGGLPRIVLYGFGGMTIYQPVYRRRAPSNWGKILISFAGPGVGFLAAVLLLILCWVMGNALVAVTFSLSGFDIPFLLPEFLLNQDESGTLLSLFWREFSYDFLFVCFFWGVINLFPIFPLDGGQISRALFAQFDRQNGVVYSLWLSVFCSAGFAILCLQAGMMLTAIFFGFFAVNSYQQLQMSRWR